MAIDDDIKKERAFIHDLSSPLMIAMGMIESLQTGLDEDNIKDQKMKAEKALKALNRIADLVKERRSLLVEKTKS